MHKNKQTENMKTSGLGQLLGPTLGLEKPLHTKKKLKTKNKDGHNRTKIGASNIFRVISLDSEFQLSSSSNT